MLHLVSFNEPLGSPINIPPWFCPGTASMRLLLTASDFHKRWCGDPGYDWTSSGFTHVMSHKDGFDCSSLPSLCIITKWKYDRPWKYDSRIKEYFVELETKQTIRESELRKRTEISDLGDPHQQFHTEHPWHIARQEWNTMEWIFTVLTLYILELRYKPSDYSVKHSIPSLAPICFI